MMLSEKSMKRMAGVDPRLIAVMGAAAAISPIPFQVTEGLRTMDRQKMLCQAGKSMTMSSRHCVGEAVDIVCLVNGQADWTFANYRKVADAVKAAAQQLNIAVEWGGDWTTFKDGPHFQLKRISK